MKKIIVKNYDEASQEAFKIIKALVETKPNAVLGLATGTTPIGLYQLMIKDFKENHTSYKDIKTFNLDEYYGLPENHRQSYKRFMKEELFNHIDINLDNTYIPNAVGDVEASCQAYAQLLEAHPVDLQLLGIGSNAHIGFNEPGCDFESTTRLVDLVPSTIEDNARLFFDGDLTAVPKTAVTMGIKNIMASKAIVLVASGVGKAAAIKGLVEGPITNQVPASILQNHPNVTIIIDEDAASLLTK